jgi:predicted ABC-type ATPase
MDYSKPVLLVISGPNGAGKSTHIQTMLPAEMAGVWSFDRDNTRVGFELLLKEQGVAVDSFFAQATKMMEEKLVLEMKKAVALQEHFVLETPLSHPDYWRYIDLFEKYNYQIQLNYLCLDKVSDCIARVGQRVMEGGHYVAPNTIQGVYEKNLQHINEYKNTFKVIELYDGMIFPTLLARIEDDKVTYATKEAMKKDWIRLGLPDLRNIIGAYL